MTASLAFLLTGALLGLSGGLAPGPLLTLVANETLRHGARAGIGVALAPLLTDLPIVLITVGLLQPPKVETTRAANSLPASAMATRPSACSGVGDQGPP